MKVLSCNVEILPDGQLVLPPEIVRRLNLKKKNTHRIIIMNQKATSKKSLSDFCGKWKDDRDADEIISEIYADRDKNLRSDRFSL